MIEAIEALKNSGKVIVDEDHDWGYQLRFVNEPEYCGKLLVLENDTPGSLHYHEVKKETFIVMDGKVLLDIHSSGVHELTKYPCILNRGDVVTLMPNTPHLMKNGIDGISVILEVSTHDDDDDTYRIKEDADEK